MTRFFDYLILFVSLVLVSTAGPFLVASEMDVLATVSIRLIVSAAVFFAWAMMRAQIRVPKGHMGRVVAGAALLVAHFVFWFKAFDLTDYASNMLLLVAQPIFAALLAPVFGESINKKAWFAVGIAVVGMLIIAGGDLSLGPKALLGDLLGVMGALAIALFFGVTKNTRHAMPMPTFMAWTFGVGALMVTPIAIAAGDRFTGYSMQAWGWMAALIVLTTLIGHGLMNVAAKRLELFPLQVVIVLEPPIGIALGAVIFGAGYTNIHLIGGLVLSSAVVIGLWPDRKQPAVDVEPALNPIAEPALLLAPSGSGDALRLSDATRSEGKSRKGEGVESVVVAARSPLRTPTRSSL